MSGRSELSLAPILNTLSHISLALMNIQWKTLRLTQKKTIVLYSI